MNTKDWVKHTETFEKQLNVNACDYAQFTIEQLMLSARPYHLLKVKKVRYVSDVLRKSPAGILKLRKIGIKSVKEIIKKLYEFVSKNKVEDSAKNNTKTEERTYTAENSFKKLENIFYKIPEYRRNNLVKYYIDAYPCTDKTREIINSCYSSANDKLGDIIRKADPNNEIQISMACKFLDWCNFNLQEEISMLFEKIFDSPRTKEIIESRANNHTLQEIGETSGISRERVRQVVSRARTKISSYLREMRILPKIYADKNGQNIITRKDLELISGKNAAVLIYFLKDIRGTWFKYDSQLDVFTGNDISSKIKEYVDSLPDVIHKTELKTVLDTANDKYGLNPSLLKKAIDNAYKTTGDVLHKSRLTLAKIYDSVLRKYYPNGIHVYDDNEIATLRQHVYKEYGNIRDLYITLPSINIRGQSYNFVVL